MILKPTRMWNSIEELHSGNIDNDYRRRNMLIRTNEYSIITLLDKN